MSKLTSKRVPLFAVLFLAAFLRIYHLGAESLWLDEGVTTRFAGLTPSEIVEQSKTDNNFPTYYLMLRYWIAVFGDSEFSIRLPSALAGVLAVLVAYEVGRLLFDQRTALVASLILALSPFHVPYSQEARVYELMAFLGLLSFYFFLKVIESYAPVTRAGYVLSTVALIYSHVYGPLLVLAQNAYFAAVYLWGKTFGENEAKPGLRVWISLQILLLVLYIPGLVLLAGWVSRPMARAWVQPPTPESVYADLVLYAGSPTLLALLLAFSVLGAVGLVKSGIGGIWKLTLLLSWWIIPVALPLVISVFSTPIFSNRYAIAATPAFYLLAAKGVGVASDALSGKIPRAWRANTVLLVAAAALVALSSGQLLIYYEQPNKADWRNAAQHVDVRAQADDLVLIYPHYNNMPFDYYTKGTVAEEVPLKPPDEDANAQQLIQRHDRVWVVQELSAPEQLFPHQLLQESHELVYREEQYAFIAVALYERE